MAKLLDLQGLQAMGKGIRSEGDCALRGFMNEEGNGREGGGKFSLLELGWMREVTELEF